MVVFLDLSGSKADLIAVRAVALGSFQSNLSLRELGLAVYRKEELSGRLAPVTLYA